MPFNHFSHYTSMWHNHCHDYESKVLKPKISKTDIGTHKDHFCQVWLILLQEFQRRHSKIFYCCHAMVIGHKNIHLVDDRYIIIAIKVSSNCFTFMKTRSPWATICSPEQNSHRLSADTMQHSSNITTAPRTQIWPYRKMAKVILGSSFELMW